MSAPTNFWNGRRVLVTGSTGFKGSWLCSWLLRKKARVAGVALAPDTSPALFEQLKLGERVEQHFIDLREPDGLREVVADFQPEIIFHLAAQSLVRQSYIDPVGTWATNVMGTAHVLDAARDSKLPCTIVATTTDKVYRNREWLHGYRETDELGGHDPYSASKAAMELLLNSWRDSFRSGDGTSPRLASTRAGNVIGGGDWSKDRILPDLARAWAAGNTLSVRNPASTRPWQHVLEPLSGYMMLAEQIFLSDRADLQDAFNFGPESSAQRSVGDLVDAAHRFWNGKWVTEPQPDAPHEAGKLMLSIDKAKTLLGWTPRWNFEQTVARTIDWYRDASEGGDIADLVERDIEAFEAGA